MGRIIKYNHHSEEEVSVQEHLKGRHREHCLCHQNCRWFAPHRICQISKILYELCINWNIVTPVWECPDYEEETASDTISET